MRDQSLDALSPLCASTAAAGSGVGLPALSGTTNSSRRADAVLVAVGKPRFLRADMVKPGAAVIDIGINDLAQSDDAGAAVFARIKASVALYKSHGWTVAVCSISSRAQR